MIAACDISNVEIVSENANSVYSTRPSGELGEATRFWPLRVSSLSEPCAVREKRQSGFTYAHLADGK